MNTTFLKLAVPTLVVVAMLVGCNEATPSQDGTDTSGTQNPTPGSSAPASSSVTPMSNQGQASPAPGNSRGADGTSSQNALMNTDATSVSASSINRPSSQTAGQTSRQEAIPNRQGDRGAATSVAAGAVPAGEKADNSARNAVDKDGRTMTPFDQGNSAADIEMTSMIRKALTDDKSLSINAQNVKVISNHGEVVLRGPVASAAEADTVLMHTRQIIGVTRVTNQIVLP